MKRSGGLLKSMSMVALILTGCRAGNPDYMPQAVHVAACDGGADALPTPDLGRPAPDLLEVAQPDLLPPAPSPDLLPPAPEPDLLPPPIDPTRLCLSAGDAAEAFCFSAATGKSLRDCKICFNVVNVPCTFQNSLEHCVASCNDCTDPF